MVGREGGGGEANSFSLENKSEFHCARTIAPFEVRSSSLWLVYNRDEVVSADPLKMRKRIFIIGRGHAAENHYACLRKPCQEMKIVFFQLNEYAMRIEIFYGKLGRD